jgi:hypothetical protein
MDLKTLEAFSDELTKIAEKEKDEGVKDVLQTGAKALKRRAGAGKNLATRGMSALHANPIAHRVMNYAMDPMNTADMAQTLSKIIH